MEINVLKAKETLSVEEAIDVKGGLNSSLGVVATMCTCDCIFINTNDETTKPIEPQNNKVTL